MINEFKLIGLNNVDLVGTYPKYECQKVLRMQQMVRI